MTWKQPIWLHFASKELSQRAWERERKGNLVLFLLTSRILGLIRSLQCFAYCMYVWLESLKKSRFN